VDIWPRRPTSGPAKLYGRQMQSRGEGEELWTRIHPKTKEQFNHSSRGEMLNVQFSMLNFQSMINILMFKKCSRAFCDIEHLNIAN
jgi:hypothetical protein